LIPKGLTRQLLAVLFLVALTGIVGVSLAAWQAERQVIEEQVDAKLVVVANLKRDRLQNWLAERQDDVQMIAANQINQEDFNLLLDTSLPQTRKDELILSLRDSLIGLQYSRSGYVEILMMDSEGTVLVGTDPAHQGKPFPALEAATRRFFLIDGSSFYDIFFHPDSGRPVMLFGHVIRSFDGQTHQMSDEVVGEVFALVDMEYTVYRFLGPIAELGVTAEALLVRPEEDGIRYLSQLLFQENAPLNLSAGPDSPLAAAAQQAAMGATETFHSIDYARQPVIVAYREIAPVGWGLVVKQAESEAFAPIADLARRIVLLTFLVLLGTAGLALYLTPTVIQPIAALVQATQAIAGGDLGISLQTKRQDELGALSSSFQRMVAALAAQRQEAQRLAHALERRADELESAYSDLRRSDQLKDAFIRNITHELRTPVAALSGFTELLTDEAENFTPEQREMLDVVAGQTRQISRLVKDVASLHEIDSGSDERRPVSLADLVRSSLANCQKQRFSGRRTPAGAHTFDLQCTDEDVAVFAHPGQISRVVDSLLDNAVKFSPEGGPIHIQVRRVQKWDANGQTADWQVVSVTDTGIGIAEEKLPHIWERFYQADDATTRRFGGAGLGLALVKETVEAHGGKVWADSLLGEGTTVSFSLPVHHLTPDIGGGHIY